MLKRGLPVLIVLFILSAALPGLAKGAPAETRRRIQRTTASGMSIILEKSDAEAAQITLLLKSGSGLEPPAKKGIAGIMNNIVYWILNDPKATSDVVDIQTAPDYTLISLTTLATDIRPALAKIKWLLTQPIYSYDVVVDLKKYQGNRIKAFSGLPQAYFDFTKEFYGPGHPYNNWPDPETIKSITGADVYKWYRQTYQPGNAVLSITGNVTESLAALEKFFAALPNVTVDRRLLVQPVAIQQSRQLEREDRNAKAASVCIGFAAPRIQDPEYPAFKVITYYLDGYFHYFEELRLKEGLFYSPEIYYNYLEKPNAPNLAILLMTDPETVQEVTAKTVAIMKGLAENGITPEEIGKVVKAIKAESAANEASGAGQATLNALSQYFRTPLVYDTNLLAKLDQIKTEDIKNAANKYLKNYVQVSYIPKKTAEDL